MNWLIFSRRHATDVSITHHLQVGDPVLPPQVFLEFGSHGCQHVVEVHDDVHEGVDDADEGAVSSGEVLGASPRDHRHDGVVVQVQERYLVILFPQDEEDRV